MALAGIVLCGGASRRMGQPKAWLEIGGSLVLVRIVNTLSQVASPIIVAAGPRQELPALPQDVVIRRDANEHLGPLAGIATGLRTLSHDYSHVVVSSCDSAFLNLPLLQSMAKRVLPDHAVFAVINGQRQPLPAIYPTNLREQIESALNRGERSLRYLRQITPSIDITEVEVRVHDPELLSFMPMNTRDEYLQAQKLSQQQHENEHD